MNLVSVADAAEHIRTDSARDDQWLELWIPIVSASVAAWLKDEWRLYVPSGFEDSQGDPIPEFDSQGEPIVNPIVAGAVMLELAQQYRFRDGSGAQRVASHEGHGYVLGAGATALLAPLRRSTVA